MDGHQSRGNGERAERGRFGRAVVSADDFGMTSGVNRGIVELLEGETISATALILGHPGTAEALDIARSLPVLDLGLHINLTDGLSVTKDRRLAAILDSGGGFLGRRRLALGATTRSLDLEGVRAEVNAQIEACFACGLQLTHIDSHHYVHVLPGVSEIIRECASDAGIPLIRASHWRSVVPPMTAAVTGTQATGRLEDRGEDGSAPERPDPRPATDFVLPLGASRGPVPLSVLGRMLASIARGSVEIIAHPGYADDELANLSAYVGGRERELQLLGSGQLDEALHAAGLHLSSFRELASGA